nr:glutamine--tRNA ligase [Nannocystis sp.]
MSHTDETPNDLPPNFIRDRIVEDRQAGKNGGRVVTRFPPEPNGYLHVGHAKSLCLNFGSAAEFAGRCHLRFDDTNPATEELEYVEAIKADVRWLGFDWGEHLFFASDYFEQLYAYAVALIKAGKAYVCSLSADQIKEYRGDFHHKGKDSPYRERSVAENLDLFARMRAGEFADGQHVLRAKIDMAAGNINMRDPPIYRIKHAHHHRTGDKWCIYPMYDYAHCVSDAIEGITHSLCTLEFEDHRPLYDWILDQLDVPCHPQQIEFAKLNFTYIMLSKRRLLELVRGGQVKGWDDPRMPTLSGMRRRGYTPEALRNLCERVGVSKHNSVVDVTLLEHAVREHLNATSRRVMGVLRPLRVVLSNWPEGQVEWIDAPYFADDPARGTRRVPLGRELFIEHDDFKEVAVKGLVSPEPRRRGPAAARRHRALRRGGEGRGGRGGGAALHARPGDPQRRAAVGAQGEGDDPLAVGRARAADRGAPLRPPVSQRVAGRRGSGRALHGQHQPAGARGRAWRLRRAEPGRRGAGHAGAVRAPGVLLRRPRLNHRTAGLQPHDRPARLVGEARGQVGRGAALTGQRAAWYTRRRIGSVAHHLTADSGR